ncbi:tetratricopeptide repeat protein [Flavobacterium sp. DGU11]|uniref:Tetratricopeptide repeat protein n=1 Tax=Flavobacterium arundinis TaxID=3139143 RepID=A0ABU9I175_9FLAO
MKKHFLFLLIMLFASNAQSQAQRDEKLLKKYAKAIDKFNNANDSSKAEFYYKRGGIRQDYLDLQGAITDYNKTLKLEPENAKAYYNRGLAKMDLELLKEAILDFTKAIEIDPMNDFAYNNRGICKYMQENYPAAIEDYTMAIQVNPKFAEAYNNRASSRFEMGLINEGCEDLHRAYDLGLKNSMNGIKKYCERI